MLEGCSCCNEQTHTPPVTHMMQLSAMESILPGGITAWNHHCMKWELHCPHPQSAAEGRADSP